MEFEKIGNEQELRSYLDEPFKHMGGIDTIYHYTSLESLEKICETGTLKFSPVQHMNDVIESEWAAQAIPDTYFACFIKSKVENNGLWAMYGGIADNPPEKIYVKIGFPLKVIKKLCQAEHIAYKITARNIVYTNMMHETEDAAVKTFFRSGSGMKNEQKMKITPDKLAGYVKDLSWNYENEFRLATKANENSRPKNIDIPINNVLSELMVIPSPCFSKKQCESKFKELAGENTLKIHPEFIENPYYKKIISK